MNPTKKIKISKQQEKIIVKKDKLPGILIDIDGVFFRGKIPIERSAKTLYKLRQPLANCQNEDVKIPFTLLTNGGGDLEKNLAKVVNERMGFLDKYVEKIEEEIEKSNQKQQNNTDLDKENEQLQQYIKQNSIEEQLNSLKFESQVIIEQFFENIKTKLQEQKQDIDQNQEQINLSLLNLELKIAKERQNIYKDILIKAEEMIINFTPLRHILQEYKDNNQLILIGGTNNYTNIMTDIGITKYITVQEYVRCFPKIMPLQFFTEQEIQEQRDIITKRLELQNFDFQKEDPFQIHSVFLLNEPRKQEEVVQLICDLCTTENGTISKVYPFEKPKEHIPIYVVNNDFISKQQFNLPRLSFGSLNMTLEACAKRVFDLDLKIKYYGKPEKVTFEYAKKRLQERFGEAIEFTNFYMIGDNPESDIQGANNSSIISILVSTGVHQEKENSKNFPAKYFVKDFCEAINLIYKLENLETQK